MNLVPIDPTNALAVSDYLTRARDWLATAVERTGPTEIAAAKAEIATAAEATKQLGLSKEIQDDAKEMVRRAEYALGKAIKAGQERGEIRTKGETGVQWDRWNGLQRETTSSTKPSATDFAKHHELRGEHGIQAMTDGVTAEVFEAALSDAKAEGDLSRANVVRKVKGQQNPAGLTRSQRADLIADLAEQGYTSHQMADKVGVRADTVREIARAFDIDINADRVVGRGGHRINHTAAVESAVTSLDNWASSLSFIDFSEVDDVDAAEWVASLKESRTRLSAFISAIEKRTARAATRAVQTTNTGATNV